MFQTLIVLGTVFGNVHWFLAELEAGADVRPLLERYAALPADFIRELGGDRITRRFVLIQGGRHE